MSTTHSSKQNNGQNHSVTLVSVPDECPQCHRKGTFSPVTLYTNDRKAGTEKELEVLFRCPNSSCHELFIAYYRNRPGTSSFNLASTAPVDHQAIEFSATINKISDSFVTIFNQAKKAEDMGLDKICGVGYRKAFEFLIKDYLISCTDDEPTKQSIKDEFLGVSISNRVDNSKIKEIAKRATWLGNDETHYTRKWEEKDLNDLKMTIDLTAHWIEAEVLTQKVLDDMPDPTQKKETKDVE